MSEQDPLPPLAPPIPPTTTHQEDLTTAGQRKINLIWEWTQAFIAMIVVIGYIIIASWCMIKGKEIPSSISLLTGNVIGFYFSRTNHAAIGGIGIKPEGPYVGR